MTVATEVRPVAGPRFRKAAALEVGGEKRRKLLCLIAAYADAGESSPRMRSLARVLGLHPCHVDSLLDRLVADGWLVVEWACEGSCGKRAATGKRNVYRLGGWSSTARGHRPGAWT